MTSRREKRSRARRAAKHKSLRRMDPYCDYRFWMCNCNAPKMAKSLTRTGSIRHQPSSVRRRVLGKRKIMTRAESEHLQKIVDEIISAVVGRVLIESLDWEDDDDE